MNRITYQMSKAVKNKLENAGREVLCINCKAKALFKLTQMVDAAINREKRRPTSMMEVLVKINEVIEDDGSIQDIQREVEGLGYEPIRKGMQEILATITLFDVGDWVYSKPGQGASGGKKIYYCMECVEDLNLK